MVVWCNLSRIDSIIILDIYKMQKNTHILSLNLQICETQVPSLYVHQLIHL